MILVIDSILADMVEEEKVANLTVQMLEDQELFSPSALSALLLKHARNNHYHIQKQLRELTDLISENGMAN